MKELDCVVCSTKFIAYKNKNTCSEVCRIERRRERQRVHDQNNYPARYYRSKGKYKVNQYQNPEAKMWRIAKSRAKVSGLAFDIEISDIIIPEVCPVFGLPLVRHTRMAPSLDKIIPRLGYVKGNIQVISRKANLMKQDATPEELEMFAKWVLNTKN